MQKLSIAPIDRVRPQGRIFKALGHPARLVMVIAIGHGERCVGELAELVGFDLSTVSRHLAVLTGAGVLSSEKRGNQVFFRLARPCVMTMLACLAKEDGQSLPDFGCAKGRCRR